MQPDTRSREQLRAQFASAGLDLDDERLDSLIPVYTGLLNGAGRIAALDLGEREPAMAFRHQTARTEGRR